MIDALSPSRGTYELSNEIPTNANQTTEHERNFLLFAKYTEGPLVGNQSLATQIIATPFNPDTVFDCMMPYIRHAFIPLTAVSAQKEEEKAEKNKANIAPRLGARAAVESLVSPIFLFIFLFFIYLFFFFQSFCELSFFSEVLFLSFFFAYRLRWPKKKSMST